MPFRRGPSTPPSNNSRSNFNRNNHNQQIDPLTACLDADGTYLCVISNPRCYIIQKVNPQRPSSSNPPQSGWIGNINNIENNTDSETATSSSLDLGTYGDEIICHHHRYPYHHHHHHQNNQHYQFHHHHQTADSVSYMNGESSKVNSEIAYVGTTTVSESSEAPMAGPAGSSMAPQHPSHHSHEYMLSPPPPPQQPQPIQDPSMVSLHTTPVVNRLAELNDGQVMGHSEASGGGPGPGPSSNFHLRPHQTSNQQNDSIEKLKSQILFQILFYFSPQNLARDRYLLSQMDNDQYVPISTIASFNLVKELTTDLDLITETLKESNAVEVDAEGLKVRPNPQRCIVILREIPDNTPIEEIKDLFMGENCPRILSCEFVHNESWYITFESSEDAQKAYFYLREEVKVFQGRPIMARIKANTNHGLLNQQTPSSSSSSSLASQVKNGYRNTSTPHAVYDPASYPPGQQRFVYTNGTPGQSVAPVTATAAAAAAATASYNPIVYPYQHQYPNAYVAWPQTASGYFDLSPVFQVNGLAPQQFKHPAYRPSPSRPRSTNKHRSIQQPQPETNSSTEQQQGPSNLPNQNRVTSASQLHQQQHSTGLHTGSSTYTQHHHQSQQNNNQSGGTQFTGASANQNASSMNQNKLPSKIVRDGGNAPRVILETPSESNTSGSYANAAVTTPSVPSAAVNDLATATHPDTRADLYGYAVQQQQQQQQSFLLKDSSIPPRYRRKRRDDDITNGNGQIDSSSSVQTQTQQVSASDQSQGVKMQFDYADEAFPPLPGMPTNGFPTAKHHHGNQPQNNQSQPAQKFTHHHERSSQTSSMMQVASMNESKAWVVKGGPKTKINNDRNEEKELENGEIESKLPQDIVSPKGVEKERHEVGAITDAKNGTGSLDSIKLNKVANRTTTASAKCTMTDKSTRTDDLPNGCEQDNESYPTTTNAATMTTSGIVQADAFIKTPTVTTNSTFPKHDTKDPGYTEMFPALPTSSDEVDPPRKSYAQVTQHLTKENQPKAVKQIVAHQSVEKILVEGNVSTATVATTTPADVNTIKTATNQNQHIGGRNTAQPPISERDGIKEYRDGGYRNDRMGGSRNINHRYGGGSNGPGSAGIGGGGRRKMEVRQPQLLDYFVTKSSK